MRKSPLCMTNQLDEIDKRIIYHLTNDARNTSAPTIAEEVNVSAGTIRNRINQLEDEEIITGYHAGIDYERVERRLTDLFVCHAPVPDRETLAQQVLDIPGVINVKELMAGRGNLHVTAVGTDMDDLTRIARALSNLGIEIETEDLIQHEFSCPYQPFGPEEKREQQVMTNTVNLTGDAEVIELTVGEDTPIADRTLEQASENGLLDDEVLLIAIERDETIITPKGHTQIQPGDIVSIFSPETSSESILHAFGGA